MQDPIPVLPRRQPGAADTKSLVALGQAESPPTPSTDPFLEPAYPDGTAWTDGTEEPA